MCGGSRGENNEVNSTANGFKHPIEEQEMTELHVYRESGTVQLVITVILAENIKVKWMTRLL